ncbi:MAG TPA: hypothetical protein VJ464_30490 [Blastocatellia bacterium]|nr:hypothetical protein [Blastocatellia bacterium]
MANEPEKLTENNAKEKRKGIIEKYFIEVNRKFLKHPPGEIIDLETLKSILAQMKKDKGI